VILIHVPKSAGTSSLPSHEGGCGVGDDVLSSSLPSGVRAKETGEREGGREVASSVTLGGFIHQSLHSQHLDLA
jgi:hypothetical protein